MINNNDEYIHKNDYTFLDIKQTYYLFKLKYPFLINVQLMFF